MPRKPDIRKKERFYDPFPSNFRFLLEETGLSQQEVAESLGVSRQMITNYQDGTTVPDIEKLQILAKLFDVSSDWLLGLSDYRYDKNKRLTVDEMGFSERATLRIASIAGSVLAAEDFGDQAKRKVYPDKKMNPNGYTCQQEAQAFLALNALLEKPEFVLALSNAWAYAQYSGQFDLNKTITLGGEDLPESFSAPCGVLVDALWHRVEEPLRKILDEMAQEVKEDAEEDRK